MVRLESLYSDLMGEGEWRCKPQNKWFLGKMTGALQEWLGGIIVCGKICQGVVLTFSLLVDGQGENFL